MFMYTVREHSYGVCVCGCVNFVPKRRGGASTRAHFAFSTRAGRTHTNTHAHTLTLAHTRNFGRLRRIYAHAQLTHTPTTTTPNLCINGPLVRFVVRAFRCAVFGRARSVDRNRSSSSRLPRSHRRRHVERHNVLQHGSFGDSAPETSVDTTHRADLHGVEQSAAADDRRGN